MHSVCNIMPRKRKCFLNDEIQVHRSVQLLTNAYFKKNNEQMLAITIPLKGIAPREKTSEGIMGRRQIFF